MTSSPITNSPFRNWRATSINSAQPRLAILDDVERLQALIEASARGLSDGDYSVAQLDAALQGTFGVDTQLIRDGTYWVIEECGSIVAAGGWSYRATLFGGDQHVDRVVDRLDPACDAARIRAFFVQPTAARRGFGRQLLAICEREAALHGFGRLTLLATLPGRRLYEVCGFVADVGVNQDLGGGVKMPFVAMHKFISKPPSA